MREVLDDLVCLSLPVARIWGFNDSKDTSSIRRSPEEGFREEGLRGLDQAVWEAKRRGIRLILPLVNNWGEYGGLPAYAAWAAKRYGSPIDRDDFYRDVQMKQWWKDYVFMLVNRVNTFTGVAYRDEPAILAWEIGNELRCGSCAGTTRLPDTIAELATFLKQIAPNQLVADGGDGFDDDPTPVRGPDQLLRRARRRRLQLLEAGTHRRARHALVPLLPAQLRLLDAARRRALDRPAPGARDGDRQGRLPRRVRIRRARRRARPELRRLAASSVRVVRRPARAVLAALAGRPREQRRLRGLLAPRQRDRLDPRPLGQGHPLSLDLASRVGNLPMRGQPVDSEQDQRADDRGNDPWTAARRVVPAERAPQEAGHHEPATPSNMVTMTPPDPSPA